MHCQICAQPAEQLFARISASGMLNLCCSCKDLKPSEQRDILMSRADDGITGAKLLYAEAYRENDHEGMNQMQSVIDLFEKSKMFANKPQ